MIFKKQDGNLPSCFCMLLKCAECPPTAISASFACSIPCPAFKNFIWMFRIVLVDKFIP